ncbi:hypothetical protein BH10BAC2_BH10BAC2_32710 [soil metagenome]
MLIHMCEFHEPGLVAAIKLLLRRTLVRLIHFCTCDKQSANFVAMK